MQFLKSIRYRISLIQRGEIESATVQRLTFIIVQAVLAAIMLNIFYWLVWNPIETAWAEVSEALSKPKT